MTKNSFAPSHQCAKAADRLSAVFNCSSILQYAGSVCNESELHLLSRLLSKIGLHSSCSRADLNLCLDYLDDLAYAIVHPQYNFYNDSCQQFLAPVNNPSFYSPQPHGRKDIAA